MVWPETSGCILCAREALRAYTPKPWDRHGVLADRVWWETIMPPVSGKEWVLLFFGWPDNTLGMQCFRSFCFQGKRHVIVLCAPLSPFPSCHPEDENKVRLPYAGLALRRLLPLGLG